MQVDQQQHDVLDGKYNLLKKIGTGATANVKLAQAIGKDGTFACKLLKDSESRLRNTNLKHFNAEIENLKKLNHENIINLVDSGTGMIKKVNGVTKQKNYVILEYAANCELFDYVYFPKKGFGEYFARAFFKQLLNGLDHCHKAGVAHRDLKTENLMLSDEWKLKIADFGYATGLEGKNENGLLTTFLGTLSYAAPEIIAKKFYKGTPADIFSCGVILYILTTGKLPFGKAAVHDVYYRNFIRKDQDQFWKVISPKLDMEVSKEFKSLINAIFTYEADQRIKMEDIFNHEWMLGDIPSQEEIEKELEQRDKIVKQMKELEAQENEEDGDEIAYGGVYRSAGDECQTGDLSSRETCERIAKEYTKSNNPYKVSIKEQNINRLYRNLINYFEKDGQREKTIEKDPSYFKFSAKFALDKDLADLVDENMIIQNLEVQVEIKKIKDQECIIEWNKIKGDKIEFFDMFSQFKESY